MKKTTSTAAIKVRVTDISREAISIPVHSTGSVVSSEEMKLSFKIGGIIAKIMLKKETR